MTDQVTTGATEEAQGPQFSLQRIYVRDLSFETKLPYGDSTFTLYPSLFPATAHGSFTINVYCVADFELLVGGGPAPAAMPV